MRLSKLVGNRIKEAPKDAQSSSHIFLIRGGYIRPVSAGIYTLLPLGQRIISKVENIIREEMNMIDGQEMLMPVVLPAELWQESGRYDSVDETLLRFKDRNEKDMLLAMTHEEAVCQIARTELTSYKQYPAMVYQIQTKYRDEARARAGLIRVREFTMKDAYSFHTNLECLEKYYAEAHEAYERIFKRVGMKDFLSIQSDAGMMGGKVSHEFMAVSEIGEDTIFASPCRKYLANKEIATTALTFTKEDELELEKVETPDVESIEDVAKFLGLEESQTSKAVFYQSNDTEDLIFALIRGDIEVNETKLKNHLQLHTLYPAEESAITAIGAVAGFASTLNIKEEGVRLVVDPSVAESSNLVCGANEKDFHYKNYNHKRDAAFEGEIVDIATARDGDPCPVTGAPLEALRGIEIGNIFQLGDRYSSSMSVSYLNQSGKAETPIMGCYGIGVGRTMASVLEQAHDESGPVWPISIAPFHVHIVAIKPKKEGVSETSEALYKELQQAGIEVVYDDRGASPGFAFSDADLIGVPFRAVVSPKTLADGEIEFKTRDGEISGRIPVEGASQHIIEAVQKALAEARNV